MCIFKIKFPTKRIFQIIPILRINGMAPFCNCFVCAVYTPSFIYRPDAPPDTTLKEKYCTMQYSHIVQ